MKNTKIFKNYFSQTILSGIIVFFCVLIPHYVSAQLSFGGQQVMFWGSDVCNGSGTNVHFILNEDGIITLYDSPATDAVGDSDVDFGVSQVGTYEEVPTECEVSDDPDYTLWVTDGIYETISTSVAAKDKFFAGNLDPFIKKIKTEA